MLVANAEKLRRFEMLRLRSDTRIQSLILKGILLLFLVIDVNRHWLPLSLLKQRFRVQQVLATFVFTYLRLRFRRLHRFALGQGWEEFRSHELIKTFGVSYAFRRREILRHLTLSFFLN